MPSDTDVRAALVQNICEQIGDDYDRVILPRAKWQAIIAALQPSTAISEDRARMREALEWYGEQARLARLIHSEGDAGRHALAKDGGKRARAILQAEEAPDGR